MFGHMLPVLGVVQTVVSVGTLAGIMISMIRSGAGSEEEQQRAGMRSMSWPGSAQ